MNQNLVLMGAAVALAGIIVGVLWPTQDAPSRPGQTLADDGAGGVAFSATLRPRSSPSSHLDFSVQLDTHDGDLRTYDLLRHILVESRSAQRFAPLAGSAVVRNESHHVRAQLYFPSPGDGPIALVALDLRGVPERRLVFEP